MKKLLPFFCFFCVINSLSAQKTELEQWQDAEYDLGTAFRQQDTASAITYAEDMWWIAEKHFNQDDSLYWWSVNTLAQVYTDYTHYIHAKQLVEGQLLVMEAKIKEQKPYFKKQSSWLLYHGNACVLLGDVYTYKRPCADTLFVMPEQDEERFKQALANYNQAIASYMRLKELRPDHPVLDNNLGLVYRQKGELQGRWMGDLEASKESLEQSLIYQKNVDALRMLGVVNGIMGNVLEAISFFEQALALSPDNIAIMYNLEVAYLKLTQMETNKQQKKKYAKKATSYRKKWRKIDPNYVPE